MTRAIKLLRSRITSAVAIGEMAGQAVSHSLNLHFSYKPINPTTMTKIQLNSVFGAMPPANPLRVTTQLD